MKDEQNQFYSSISKYYSEIFPYQPMQLQFVKSRAGELNGIQILDIGCATCELAFQLANEGANVTGIDLNEDLLNQAKNKSANFAFGCGGFQTANTLNRKPEPDKYRVASPNPRFQTGNMLELETDFHARQFDVVLCFGNTLVHLQTVELIQQMLKGVFTVLKPDGQFLLQILNYDYILKESISELPLIETENIQFIRKYKFEEKSPLIRFQTELVLKNENKSVLNETPLFALRSAELIVLLQNAGFNEIELFSSFKNEPFGGKHLPLMINALKH